MSAKTYTVSDLGLIEATIQGAYLFRPALESGAWLDWSNIPHRERLTEWAKRTLHLRLCDDLLRAKQILALRLDMPVIGELAELRRLRDAASKVIALIELINKVGKYGISCDIMERAHEWNAKQWPQR